MKQYLSKQDKAQKEIGVPCSFLMQSTVTIFGIIKLMKFQKPVKNQYAQSKSNENNPLYPSVVSK